MSKTVGLSAKAEKVNPSPSDEASKSQQTVMENIPRKKKKVLEENRVLKKEQETQKKEVTQVRQETRDQSEDKE